MQIGHRLCDHDGAFGAQDVPLAGPELELRSDGGTATQVFELDIRVEIQAQGC